jgi:hypothetical protein
MKKSRIYYRLILPILFLANLLLASDFAHCDESIILKNMLVSRIDLLNKIIKDPDEANMKNWLLLGNPHDEIELRFYKNSISDGSKSAYNKSSATFEKLLNHSRSKSKDEPSIVLQYLRLSLMAFNVRSGDKPSVFNFKSLSQTNSSEVVVECDFIVHNASGKRTNRKAAIVFEIGDNPKTDLYLQKIYFNSRLLYGWWYEREI